MAALGSMVRLVAVLWGAGLGAPPANPPAKLLDVRAVSDASGVLVKITLSEPRSPRRMAINDPPRLVFDFPDTLLPGGSQQIDVQHKLLRAVRIGQASAEPPIARVVLDLPDRSDAVARKGDDGRTWTVALGQVGEVGRSAAAATEPPPPPPRLSAAGWAQQNGDDAVLVLKADRVPEPQTSYREDPERLVVDFAGIVGEVSVPAPAESNGVVRSVQLGQAGDGLARCIIYLKGPAGYLLLKRQSPARLEIRVARGATKGRLVVVDAGHGGHDSGTPGYRERLFEKNVALDVVLRVAKLLRGKGVRASLTRDDDTFVPLSERAEFANRLKADLFVSVHCNALPPSLAGKHTGSELYWYTDPSEAFAQVMLHEFCAATGMPNRGTYQRRFVVIRETTMPSVLVETGYLDNQHDGPLLDQPAFRQKCAVGITRGVLRYLQRLPKSLAAAEDAS